MSHDDELPWSPPRREQRLEQQFSSFLAFEPTTKTGRYLRSCWRVEKSWAEDYRTLQSAHPQWELQDWLIYFIEGLGGDRPSESQLALQHLWCFYQEDCYYLSRKWFNSGKLPRQMFSWQEIFEVVCEPLTDLNKARKSLKTFDPRTSYRKYIHQLLYHRSRDRFQQKLGRSNWQHLPVIISLEETTVLDSKDKERPPRAMASAPDLEKAYERDEADRYEKAQQSQVRELIDQELEKRRDLAPMAPTTLTLWEIMLMGYGLNIGQSGAVQVLTYNQQPIQQSHLSRKLQTLKIELFLACLAAFSEEIQAKLGDYCGDFPPEQDANFKKLAQKQHKNLDPILKEYYRDWILEFVLKSSQDAVDQAAVHLWLITQLQTWFKAQLQIILELEALTPAMIKKMGQALEHWEVELRT